MQYVISFKTHLGWITISEQNKKITSISFGKKKNIGNSKELHRTRKSIINYFLKKTKLITSNIVMSGTDLQIKIWQEIHKVPYGQTRTYSYIAKKVKTSPRYVGNVCGQNKHLLFIPCHRINRKDGKLGGYSGLGGLKVKKNLLELENKSLL